MSNSFFSDFDAIASEAFASEGMADAAQYRPTPTAAAVPCTVLIDRTVTEIDSAGNVVVAADLVRVTAFRADIGTQPLRGARFEIDAEIFTVVSVPARDESRWVCNCEPQQRA